MIYYKMCVCYYIKLCTRVFIYIRVLTVVVSSDGLRVLANLHRYSIQSLRRQPQTCCRIMSSFCRSASMFPAFYTHQDDPSKTKLC